MRQRLRSKQETPPEAAPAAETEAGSAELDAMPAPEEQVLISSPMTRCRTCSAALDTVMAADIDQLLEEAISIEDTRRRRRQDETVEAAEANWKPATQTSDDQAAAER